MHKLHIETAGKDLNEATKALIMLHGRGANAHDILSLSKHLNVQDFALLAPQATNSTWYPYSFLAPAQDNEPWLSSAIENVGQTLEKVLKAGLKAENVYFLGFSQGACLTLEFLARYAKKFGGAAVFTGGLIGEQVDKANYQGDFEQTPIFIGSANPDFHVPVERVYASANILKEMNADVLEKVYSNMGHTIIQDEIDLANSFVFKT